MRFESPRALSFGLVLTALFCLTAIASSAELLDPGAPWPKYQVEPLALPAGVSQGEITVVELVDLDGDHLLDVLAAWRVGDEAVLAAYAGGSREWRIEHGTQLMEPVVLARVPGTIAHATVADMDWDGRLDVLMALEGRSQFDWFPLASPRPVEIFENFPLPGSVTALTALDYGRRDFAASPVVGVLTAGGPQLALFPDQHPPAVQAPLLVPSGGMVREVATGNLDGDAWWDLVVATDRGVDVLAGSDSGSRETARGMTVTQSLVTGDSSVLFVLDRFERSTTHRLAIAGAEGIHLVNPKTGDRSSSLKNTVYGGMGDWIRSVWSGVGRGPAMAVADAKGLGLFGALRVDSEDVWQAGESAVVNLGGRVVMAEVGRVTPDGVDDLVVVLENSNQPVLLVATPRNTYGVTTEDDHDDGNCDGDCTLREAINAANANPGFDAIEAIPSLVGPLFYPTSQLPDITDTVSLNSLGSSWSIYGSDFWGAICVGGCNGLVVTADSCGFHSVHVAYFTKNSSDELGIGLLYSGSYHPFFSGGSVDGNEGHGVVYSDSSDAFLSGEFDGNDENGVHLEPGPGGLTANNHIPIVHARGNGLSGVRIDNVPDTMVGGTGVGNGGELDRNGFAGVNISGAGTTGTSIARTWAAENAFHAVYLAAQGAVSVGSPVADATSYFRYNVADGIKVWATAASHQITNCVLRNNETHGIAIYGSSEVKIGPDVSVGGNDKHGVFITDDGLNPSHGITIEDSVIGLIEAFNNYGNAWFGIEIDNAWGNSIGTVGHGNLINANRWGGIRIHGAGATRNSIRDNLIGTDQDGLDRGNEGAGVVIASAPSNSIGGAVDGGNVIAGNDGPGIVVDGDSAVRVGMRFNSIHDNDGIGIDLASDGVTLPDPNDSDTGPNGLLNQPLVVWAESCDGSTYITANRFSGAGIFAHDLYANSTCDATGWGEGETHLEWFFTVHPSPGRYNSSIKLSDDHTGFGITAMTTDFDSSSSEFSNCKIVSAGRAGDANADCVFAADDLAAIINVADDPSYVTPGNPDADGNGVVEAADLPIVVFRTML